MLLQCRSFVTKRVVSQPKTKMRQSVRRLQLDRSLKRLDGLFVMPSPGVGPPEKIVILGINWIQLRGPLDSVQRLFLIAHSFISQTQLNVGFSPVRSQFSNALQCFT